jgi:hypothetical protein
MLRFFCLALLVSLSACATSGAPEPIHPEALIANTREAQLADATARELAHLARFDPDLLSRVAPELRSLALALVEHGNETDVGTSVAEPRPLLAGPPDDLVNASSLRHGIHLASYRVHDNAVSGWSELQTRFPDELGDREGRLETTHIEGRGEFLRLKAGPYDNSGDAAAACSQFQAAGVYCMPVDFSGQAF